MTTKIVAEEWRPVVGFEGLYEVSNLGRVRRAAPAHNSYVGKILRQHFATGYCRVGLVKRGRIKMMLVHRMVAKAFIPRPRGKTVVNHRDFDRTNAAAWNLEWCTQRENVQHTVAAGRHNPGGWSRVHARWPTRSRDQGGRFVPE